MSIRKLLLYLVFIIFSVFRPGLDASAQSSSYMSGPSCVVPGVEYTYWFSAGDPSDYITWCINGGQIVGTGVNQCRSQYGLNSVTVIWTSGALELYAYSSSSNGYHYLYVTPASELQPGGITSAQTQTIAYNTTPATINCSVASGGYCSPTHYYQWQQSADQVNWTNMSGKTTQNLSFTSSVLTQTTYFRRRVIEGNSGTTAYSNVATVFVNPPASPLSPGAITTSTNISLPYNGVPAAIKASAASGGACSGSYSYQWQFSLDNNTFTDIELENADSLAFDEGLAQTTYFRRKVTCGTSVAYTGTVTITVALPFDPGAITSGNQAIPLNTVPAQISATAAANCSGSAPVYQWQQSLNGYDYSNIQGAGGVNLVYGAALSQSTYFRRKALCGSLVRYTNTILVQVIAPQPPVTRTPSSVDSLLEASGVNLTALFGLASDSIANSRRPVNAEYAQKDSITEVQQTLAALSNTSFTLAEEDLVIIDTTTTRDDIQARLDKSSEAGGGSDSSAAWIPFLDDNTIQLYRSTGNYTVLDSLSEAGPKISLEEAIAYANEQGGTELAVSGTSNTLITGVVNGASLVSKGQTLRYMGNFPETFGGSVATLGGSAAQLQWIVRGGAIVAQNTNPSAGGLYADVQWQSSFGTPFLALVDRLANKFAFIPISFFATPWTALPVSQTVYYNQAPSQLVVKTPALMTGTYMVHQWQVLDVYGNTNWTNISGATAATYQPSALSAAWVMYRRVTFVYVSANNSLVGTYTSSAVSVKLKPFSGGVLSATSTSIPYNTAPAINATAVMGGFYLAPNTAVTYSWEVSVNDGPWQSIGAGAGFPGYSVQYANTKFRRLAQLSGVNTSLPAAFWKGYSNELSFSTYYQTTDYENKNYIRENVVLTRGMSTWEEADALAIDQKIQTTTYLDGLSRPMQTVGKGTHYDENTGQWYDMVQSITYEAGGRVDKALLPYPSTENIGKFKNNVAADQPAYYAARFGDNNAFAKADYDNSPLNKVVKAYAPGSSWAGEGRGVSGDYEPFAATENVRRWTIGYNAADMPVSSGNYPDLSLLKQVGVDEKGKKVISYADRSGQVILKKVQLADPDNYEGGGLSGQHGGWLCTYYVYDDFGQLRFTITPKAVKELENNGWAFTQTIADELCFQYQYDDLGRTTAKKTSGKAIEYFVYDNRNRVVFTQDGNQRTQVSHEWHVSFYDALNRNIVTALYKTSKTREQLQSDMNAIDGTATITLPGDGQGGTDNLTVNQRNTTIQRYVARQAIEFTTGFESVSGDQFLAEIDPSLPLANQPQTFIVSVNPVPQIDISDPTKFTPLTYNYYDHYSYQGAKSFNGTVQLAYTGGNAEAYQNTKRFYGLPTGSKVRVLNGSEKWMTSSIFYDEEGRAIQAQEENVNEGVELTASQYHFDGRVLSTLEIHNNLGTPYTNLPILTKYKFDRIGRIKAIAKKINNPARSYVSSTSVSGASEDDDAGYKQVASYQYNELDRRVKKTFAPQFNGGQGLETIDYDYNIRGWLTGINKNYALGEYTSGQWDHYFGLYIGYDNRDGKFQAAQYNGQITGVQWKSQGDNAPRRYNFSYDNANRLVAASFTQRGNSSESWNKTKVDFSVSTINYDENGNLLNMFQKGILPGVATPTYIDQLSYVYKPQSNQLLNVNEGAPTAQDGMLSDLKDANRNATSGLDDYEYDANGNLTTDRNKGLSGGGSGQGITYNYMNLPVLINVPNKGTIQYLYDADGAKLQKIVTDNTPITTGGQAKVTTTTYIGSFVYESVVQGANATGQNLQLIAHEEGRIRIITPYSNPSDPANLIGGGIELPGGKQGVFDYFIKDHLSNVRAIITEEINKASSVCTMEDADAGVKQYEEALFGNPVNNEVAATRDLRPYEWTSAGSSAKVSKLQALSGVAKVGPNVFLKVMAGDKISAKADYYYLQNPGPEGGSTGLTAMLQSLSQVLLGGKATVLAKDQSAQISNSLGSTVPLQSLYNSQSALGNTSAPRAYLNYVFFDEQFNYVGESSGFQRVSQSGNGAAPLLASDVRAAKNGYVYVYLSNESGQPVYFDNFTVAHQRSALLQEDHYYAFGLRMAGISAKAVSTSLNPKLVSNGFQGSFSEEVADFELSYNEFMLRTYDPQIGRWTGADPYDEFPSPYTGMGNDPVSNVDPTGGFIGGGSLLGAIFGSATPSYMLCPGTTTVSMAAKVISAAAAAATSGGAFASHVQNMVAYSANAASVNNAAGGNLGIDLNVNKGNNIGSVNNLLNDGLRVDLGEENTTTPIPPIFWDEFLYPLIEAIDDEFSNTSAGRAMTRILPGYPDTKFLVFHFESSPAQQEKNGRLARRTNKHVVNPDSRIYELHEVPYKSTKEGALGIGIMRPAPANQNGAHGAALRWFFQRNNLQDGDEFYVPIYKPTLKVPVPFPALKSNPSNKTIPIRNRPFRKPETPIHHPILIPVLVEVLEEALLLLLAL